MPDGTMLAPLTGTACSTDYVEIPGGYEYVLRWRLKNGFSEWPNCHCFFLIIVSNLFKDLLELVYKGHKIVII